MGILGRASSLLHWDTVTRILPASKWRDAYSEITHNGGQMFWISLAIGILIGVFLAFFIIGIFISGKKADRFMKRNEGS